MFKRLTTGLIIVCCLNLSFLVGCKSSNNNKDKYEISAEYYDNGLIAVDLTVLYHLKYKNQDKVLFNVYPMGYTNITQNPMVDDIANAGEFNLISVTLDKKTCNYMFDDNNDCVFSVDINNQIQKKGEALINIKFAVKLCKENKRLSDTGVTVNLGNFFPMPAPYLDGEFIKFYPSKYGDPFVSECADYKVKLTVPSQYTVASTGEAKSCDVAGEKTLYTYSVENVRDFAFVLSKNYNVQMEKCGNRSVNYYFYEDNKAQNTMDMIIKALDFFENTYGDYPYKSFSVCQTRFFEGGMEYPCLVYVSDCLDYNDYLYAIVHETAHQWWYAIVGNNQLTDAYIDEGLAEYSTYLFFDTFKEYQIKSSVILESAKVNLSAYKKIADKLGYKNPLTIQKALDEFESEYQYYCLVYNKTLCLFVQVEQQIGRSKLIKKLSNMFSDNKFEIITDFNLF